MASFGARGGRRKRALAVHGLNLRMSGRLARRARLAEGMTAAELDRRVRAWRFGRTIADLGLEPIAPVVGAETVTTDHRGPGAVRDVARPGAARTRARSWLLVVDVLAGRDRRIEVPPREVRDLGLDVRVAEHEVDLDVTMPRGYLDRHRR